MRIKVYPWSDAFGCWHATARSRNSAHRAIRREVLARSRSGDRPVVRIELVGPSVGFGDVPLWHFRER